MECKPHTSVILRRTSARFLIHPKWNVNRRVHRASPFRLSFLIHPKWNVNQLLLHLLRRLRPVSNPPKMECKQRYHVRAEARDLVSNPPKMECKLAALACPAVENEFLIHPKWNVNSIQSSAALATSTFLIHPKWNVNWRYGRIRRSSPQGF